MAGIKRLSIVVLIFSLSVEIFITKLLYLLIKTVQTTAQCIAKLLSNQSNVIYVLQALNQQYSQCVNVQSMCGSTG
jgi:hypothetical protein